MLIYNSKLRFLACFRLALTASPTFLESPKRPFFHRFDSEPNSMSMTPREIVHELNRHIIGQDDAKRAVAIALRNRWRRMQLPAELRQK